MDFWKQIKNNKWIIALFIVALLIRILFVFSTPMKIWDETVYANLGYDLSHNFLDYTVANNGWSDFIPSSDGKYGWPNIGFRAPLLPYLLSLLYFFNLDWLVNFFIPLIGALSVCLVYILGKKLFNENIGRYSAIFFLLLPLHVNYSAKILTDVLLTFFILLTFISFWKGYEEENKKYKLLFGFFLALALLARYTALWIIPIFLFYFLIRDRSFKFLRDKYLWSAIGIFFLTLVPWFIYGLANYDTPLGAFIHGARAAGYWGGLQSWHFFFDYWWQMFSIVGIVSIIGVIYLIFKKEFIRKEIYLLLIWAIFFICMAIYMPHKEDRFIMPVVPAIALIAGYFFDKIKIYKKLLLGAIILLLCFSLYVQFASTYENSYTDTNSCFLEATYFLIEQEEAIVVTDESTLIYYYSKQETLFYPNPWNYSLLVNTLKDHYSEKEKFVLFTDFDRNLDQEDSIQIRAELEANSDKVFECSKDEGYSAIYRQNP